MIKEDVFCKSFKSLNDGNRLVIDIATNNLLIYSPTLTLLKIFDSGLPPKTGRLKSDSRLKKTSCVQVHW